MNFKILFYSSLVSIYINIDWTMYAVNYVFRLIEVPSLKFIWYPASFSTAISISTIRFPYYESNLISRESPLFSAQYTTYPCILDRIEYFEALYGNVLLPSQPCRVWKKKKKLDSINIWNLPLVNCRLGLHLNGTSAFFITCWHRLEEETCT